MDSLIKMTVIPNGPIKVEGMFEITKQDGTTEKREGNTFLCRCGLSKNKPYCDGSHAKGGFKG
ncbi:MAG: CDGSH iron-sulfur domain-containing protein [Fermentimonas sp.]|jgi:CDGSH-type Zn-finger protein